MRTPVIILLTPELAAEFLERNHPKNRNIRWTHVARLAKQMSEGKFRTTHQGIATDKDGFLIDGQHRCHAVVKSGVTIQIYLTEQVEHCNVMDTGSQRGTRDFLGDVPSKATVASAARIIVSFYHGKRLGQLDDMLTSDDIVEFVEANRDRIVDCVRASRSIFAGSVATCVMMSALRYILTESHPEEGNRFVDALQTGALLAYGQPVYALRARVLKNTLSRYEFGPAALKAWELHVQGKDCFQLRLSDEDGYYTGQLFKAA